MLLKKYGPEAVVYPDDETKPANSRIFVNQVHIKVKTMSANWQHLHALTLQILIMFGVRHSGFIQLGGVPGTGSGRQPEALQQELSLVKATPDSNRCLGRSVVFLLMCNAKPAAGEIETSEEWRAAMRGIAESCGEGHGKTSDVASPGSSAGAPDPSIPRTMPEIDLNGAMRSLSRTDRHDNRQVAKGDILQTA